MEHQDGPARPPALARVPTGVPGLDVVLGGGLVAGGSYLVAGPPGTGKTTLANELAHRHAAAGGAAGVATVLAETHERMLAYQAGFGFFDPDQVGRGVRYVSLLDALETGGLDAALAALRGLMREPGVTLLVVDGAAAAEDWAPSALEFRRFTQRLQAQSALLGCTTVLLANRTPEEVDALATHVDGVVLLANRPAGGRDARELRVAKLRGAVHLSGWHQFAIGADGLAVFPRLESVAGGTAAPAPTGERVGFGVPGLDAMLGGGLLQGTAALVLGTPGAGKTALGLHFLAEGARRGEPGLVAGFQESPERLVRTAEGLGLGLGRHAESGLVRVRWRAPLEISADAWAWELLAAVEEHRPRRLVVDALSDVQRILSSPARSAAFLAALANELRARGATALFVVELDATVGSGLDVPVPAVPAALDAAVLLRHAELGGRLRRLVSVLKLRQSASDPAIREFAISERGVEVGEPIAGVAPAPGAGVGP